jgi:hypothetical protein
MTRSGRSGISEVSISWGVHPIALGRHFGFIHPVMKSRRVSQIEMGHRRFKTLSHEN